MIRIVYTSRDYAADRVTGRYVRRLSKRDGGGFRVFETATGTGRFAGRAGYGVTLREYDTDGAELPDDVRAAAAVYGVTAAWPYGQ